MEESPFYESAHQQVVERGDKLVDLASREDFLELLAPLPMEVIYLLTMGITVRLVASGVKLTNAELETLVDATWRAVTNPQ